MVNYEKARHDLRLVEGDTVSFLSLVAGG